MALILDLNHSYIYFRAKMSKFHLYSAKKNKQKKGHFFYTGKNPQVHIFSPILVEILWNSVAKMKAIFESHGWEKME